MWRTLGLEVAIAAVVVGLWYFIGMHLNRQRSMRILYWVDDAIQGAGRISGLEWLSASQFLVRLRFHEQHFRHAVLRVDLRRWEQPLRLLGDWLGKRPETVTFEADLPATPSFNMDVRNQNWIQKRSPRTVKKLEQCPKVPLGPFVVTTRPEWPQNVVSLMETVSCTDHSEFLKVRIHPQSPQFAATLPLESLRPTSPMRSTLFDTMREMALGARTSRT